MGAAHRRGGVPIVAHFSCRYQSSFNINLKVMKFGMKKIPSIVHRNLKSVFRMLIGIMNEKVKDKFGIQPLASATCAKMPTYNLAGSKFVSPKHT